MMFLLQGPWVSAWRWLLRARDEKQGEVVVLLFFVPPLLCHHVITDNGWMMMIEQKRPQGFLCGFCMHVDIMPPTATVDRTVILPSMSGKNPLQCTTHHIVVHSCCDDTPRYSLSPNWLCVPHQKSKNLVFHDTCDLSCQPPWLPHLHHPATFHDAVLVIIVSIPPPWTAVTLSTTVNNCNTILHHEQL